MTYLLVSHEQNGGTIRVEETGSPYSAQGVYPEVNLYTSPYDQREHSHLHLNEKLVLNWHKYS